MSIRLWFRRLMPAALTTVALSASAALGQQPLRGVELAQPPTQSPIPAGPAAARQAADVPAADDEGGDQQATPDAGADNAALEPAPDQEADDVIELIKERYPSGAVKVEREMTQDAAGNYVHHGAWRAYDEEGRLIIDGRYVQNQREGLWRRSYRGDETELLATAPYNGFTPPLISAATFHAGQLHGHWTITDARQRKIHELEFTGGERHGRAIWYHPTGAVMLQARYENGLVCGDVLHCAADGKAIAREEYHSGRKLAPKITYYDAEQQFKKQEVTYLHALVVDKTPDNWDAGTLATFESRGEDERHGPFATWYANGQPAKVGEFRYNQPVGKFSTWYPNGQKQLEGMYADGQQEGVWTWWHENGQKAITGEYHDGAGVGQWSWWATTGKLSKKADLTRAAQTVASPPRSDLREAKLQHVEPSLPLR
jgi:antitoxin component YwqK of YwqJK toxin-antitoxin module